MTDLHLVSWNRPEMTKLVIETIHRNTRPGTFRLVVLDNASGPETIEMLEDLESKKLIDDLILIKTNLGLEAARNLMLKNCTETDYFVCIDNDCLAPPIEMGKDWLERLLDLMEQYNQYGAISMRTQVMIGTGNIFEEADEHGDDIVDFPHPGGSFRIMETVAARFVGGWDREAPGRGAEERYIGEKLNNDGFLTAFAVKVKCLHLFGNRELTKERWGYAEGMEPEETGHSDIHHPALINGDSRDEVAEYAGEKLADAYFNKAN